MRPLEEKHIILSCIAGEPGAQRALYELYLPYLLTIVRRYGFSSSDEADMVQDIYFEIFTSLEKFDLNKGTPKPWIRSIAVHTILKTKRKKGLLQIVDTEESSLAQAHHLDLSSCDIGYILKAIRSLPEGYQTVFNLYEIDGFSHKEIGDMLGISVQGSRSQLSRAKLALQRKIRKIQALGI